MTAAFVSPMLRYWTLCGVLTSLLASPAAAQSSWFGATQTAAVDDPRAAGCIALALARPDAAHDLNPNGLAQAAATFNLAPVLDALATCRLALRAFPAEPKVIVAHYNAALTLSLLLFGFNEFPDTDEVAVRKARDIAAGDDAFARRMAYFFLGSACEYGVGTSADPTEAAKWYGLAAEGGDKIAARELSRMTGAP